MATRICTVHTNADKLDLSLTYEQVSASHYPMKPVGLWYSFNNEWLQWGRDAEHRSHWISTYNYKLTFNPARILHVINPLGLHWFNNKYGIKICINPPAFLPATFDVIQERTLGINWEQVSKDYAGIEFINYHAVCDSLFGDFQLYLDSQWYQLLDMDSGCIWDLSVIQNVEAITEEQSFNDDQC